MQQSTKQRIVGTVVLLALALIFLPIIFDGQGSYQTPISSRIPDPPVVAVLPEPVQSRPVIIADTLPEPETDAASEAAGTDPSRPDAEPDAADPDTVTDSEPQAANTTTEVAITTSEPAFTRSEPELGADGLPQGWSVRLGSFSDAANAAALLERLQEAGYRAYTQIIESAQGNLTGVFVGPWLDRARVNEYQQALQEEFQLAGIVVPYEIGQL